ncbi:MAG: TonB-dependent receptor [Gammaproteobacteria bacterium]|nr:TonB-dependent receptor [Gammaproteobacteria bacterium]MYL01449.1 TonB-dependent receptor [Gammaproteobacteria bacterium]
MRFRLAVFSVLVAGVIVAPRPVIAQQGALEEIIVTARKREESVQDIPIAVSAFTADDIRELGLLSVDDIALYTPGFSFQSGFGRNAGIDRPAVRGQTTIVNGIANVKAVSTFVDGVYVGGLVSSVDLANIERVEIIKGPQSAQYGRGTYAGAINYVTRRPTDEFAGEVSLGAAEHESYDMSAWASGPLVADRAYFRVSASYRQYGGEYVNTVTNEEIGDQETMNVAAKLFLTPSDNFEATLALAYQETDDGHPALALQGREHNNCCFRGPPSGTPDISGVTGPRAREYYIGEAQRNLPVALLTEELDSVGGAGNRLERFSASLTMHYDLNNDWRLSSLTGSISDETESFIDGTYGGYDFGVAWVNGYPPFLRPRLGPLFCITIGFCGNFQRMLGGEQTDFSQELRLSSPADRPLRATLGLYYYKGKKHEDMDSKVLTKQSESLGYGLVAGTVLPNSTFDNDDVTNTAVFGGLEWDINDQWAATLEARWAQDDISVRVYNTRDINMLNSEHKDKFDSVNPRVTLSYRPDDNTNLYLNISKGSKPGDFNTQVPVGPDGQPDESFRAVEEEVAWNYEAGYKGRLLDGRMTLNVAAYRTEVTDQQFTTVIETPTGGSVSLIDNVGETEINGLEVEVETLLTESLTVNAGYAWTNAEIAKWTNVDQADLNGANGSLHDLSRLGSVAGQKVPRIPEHSASVVARYEGAEMASGFSWFVVGDVVYEGSRFSQVHNLIETGAMTRVGLRVGARRDALEVVLWARNLFDDDAPLDVLRYIDRRTGGLPSHARIPGFVPGELGNPSSTPRGFAISLPRGRQVGVTLRYGF